MEEIAFKFGDSVIFDNGITPPEKIKIEAFGFEWSSGEKVRVVKSGRSFYDVRFLRKENKCEEKDQDKDRE